MKGADFTGETMHIWKSGWWFVMRKIRMVDNRWQSSQSIIHNQSINQSS